MNWFSRFCRWMSARQDRKAKASILAGDATAYAYAANISDFWWKLGGGRGR